jgi:hypothetical protein
MSFRRWRKLLFQFCVSGFDRALKMDALIATRTFRAG